MEVLKIKTPSEIQKQITHLTGEIASLNAELPPKVISKSKEVKK